MRTTEMKGTTMDKAAKKLEALLKQQEELKKKIASEEAKIKDKRRKEDTRRKILVGSYFLEKTNPDDLKRYMNEYLTREDDRFLFDLSPTPQLQAKQPETVNNEQ
jgi:large subunit ribosomal protein L7/L12